MALRCYTVIKSGDCKVIVEIGRSSSATVLIFSTAIICCRSTTLCCHEAFYNPRISSDLVKTKFYCFRARVHCYYCLYIIFTVSPVRLRKSFVATRTKPTSHSICIYFSFKVVITNSILVSVFFIYQLFSKGLLFILRDMISCTNLLYMEVMLS